MSASLTFHRRALERAIAAIVAAGGSDEREARLVAGNLVLANLCGHDSHGVGMLPRYVAALREGGLKVNRHVRITREAGVLLALDGESGYGQAVGEEAMRLAIGRAGRDGACIMALGNAHHLGRIGHWAEMALAEGLVSLHFVNVVSHARVAPYAGAVGRFGTNPCTIGIPLPGEPPFLLDFATSAVAQGKMRVAHNKGEQVPPGRLIDDHGNPTTDPRYAVVPPFGAMLTFGEYKGYGLALACELLGGALTGATFHHEEPGRQSVHNGMLSVVFDPARLGAAEAYEREARAFLAWLREAPVVPGVDRLRIAGEPEREMRAARERDGIPVDETTWREIVAAGETLGLRAADLSRLAREPAA